MPAGYREEHSSLEDAIAFVAAHYLKDPDFPRYWSGHFSIRHCEISRLLIRKSAYTGQLQENVSYVYIADTRALQEIETHDPDVISPR